MKVNIILNIILILMVLFVLFLAGYVIYNKVINDDINLYTDNYYNTNVENNIANANIINNNINSNKTIIVKDNNIENIEELENFLYNHKNKQPYTIDIVSYYGLEPELVIELSIPNEIKLSTDGNIITVTGKYSDDERATLALIPEEIGKEVNETFTNIIPKFTWKLNGDGISFALYLEKDNKNMYAFLLQVSEQKSYSVTTSNMKRGNFQKRKYVSTDIFNTLKDIVRTYGL